MENVVGIKIKDKIHGERAFVTWGRLFDIIDEKELLNIVKQHLPKWGISHL